MNKGLIFSTLVLSTALAVTSTGCATKQGEMSTKNVRSHSYRMKAADGPRFAHDGALEANRYRGTQVMDGNVTGLHGNSNVEMSQEIADKLASVPGIKSAHVALSGRNAYVAVVEDRTGGTGRGGVTAHSARTHTITPYSWTGRELSSNNLRSGYGSTPGTAVPRTGMTGSTHRGMGTMSTAPTPFGTHPGMNGPTGTGTTGTGTAGTTGTTGTTGTGTTPGTGYASGELSDALKNQVADIVKGMSPHVQNVFVSANPDLYGRLETYANDVRAGHPIRGFAAEFSTLIERIFPQAAGSTAPTKLAPSYYSPSTVPSNRYSGTVNR
ncbi:YhcN/YlaJ family sporulation lipoprotein [Cohnella sp. AR92]|uniref:YhcN/YlaJ family sporulation lipoprotein n=1 Tax=Cohnella sp. AR92 TaxID=648716 RepID=UPI000F8CD8FD|nr:YhcN/YlaJ family sporulation lipoprotein [Cohnella sp. AR92]RUS44629.1 hypothetical protein ELR57_22870 [Cohnella sp. AR92]